VLEATAIGCVGNDRQQNFAKPRDGSSAGLAVSLGYASALWRRHLAFERATLRRQFEQALAAVVRSRPLGDETLRHQFAQNPAKALLGDAQNAEQLTNRYPRMSSNKMDHAMMRSAESVARQHRVRFGGKVAVREKQQLDPIPDHILVGSKRAQFYVRHVDLSRNLAYCLGVVRI
jgi:hypothetical protein